MKMNLGPRARGGGYSKKFYTGRLLPEVQPLTLLYTIFFRKGAPFVYLLLEKGTPFIYLLKKTYKYIVKTGSLLIIFFHVARDKLK